MSVDLTKEKKEYNLLSYQYMLQDNNKQLNDFI